MGRRGRRNLDDQEVLCIHDYALFPLIINIEKVTKMNQNFRTVLWTGTHLQATLMSIDVGDNIGLEVHPDVDQFIRIEEGTAFVQMGPRKNALIYRQQVNSDYSIFIPAGTWHNIINIGNIPLKVYSIYAPPHHQKGTIHKTKEDAEAE